MKENFIKSTIILLVGGFITKLLGMLIKIIMSRMIGTEGLGLYMLILPTFSLFIGLSQFGLPTALSKLVSEDTKNNVKLFFSIIPISLLINGFLIILIFLLAPFLSNNLLHNKDTYLSIIAIALVIPFTSISSICRSYFFGKEKMFPHIVSNIIEDIVRLLLMIIGIPLVLPLGLKYAVLYIVLSNIVSEVTSIIILLLFLPKNLVIKKSDLKPSNSYIRLSLAIGFYNTTGRLIGSIGYFLEPIILSSILLKCGYSSNFITYEYGILSGYVMPLVLLPSFFTLAISQALLPVVSKEYAKGNKKVVKRKVKQAIIISLMIGIPVTFMFIFFPSIFLKIIYHTNEGINYTRVLAPICLFQYIQSPLSFCLDAIGKSKDNFIATSIGVIIRTLFLFILSFFKIGLWGLIISISLNVLAVTFYSLKKVRSYLT